MLVGGRVRGINIEPSRLLQLIADYTLEQSFVTHVLDCMANLQDDVQEVYERLFEHAYLLPTTWSQLVREDTPQQLRMASATAELEQCAVVKAELTQALDVWLKAFEGTHHRPPKKKEWPTEMVELHARLSALRVHMQDLHDAVTHNKVNIFGRQKTSDRAVVQQTTHREARHRSIAQEAFLHQVSARSDPPNSHPESEMMTQEHQARTVE
ncbi:hypothetical protein AC1031_013562 [Aphanomyces cochlioides]|nr:hypothetical protein AC1031_013562 [Aphanomyces cochlioides]